jgi:methoxymalonate biosynthesis acyl carrier protein
MGDLAAVEMRLARLFWERLQVEVPARDTDLFEAGVLDSLVFVDLVLHVEQTFGVRVSPDDLEVENFRSIERIARFICNGSGAAHPGAATVRS